MTIETEDEATLYAQLNVLASALEPIEAYLKKIDDQKRAAEAEIGVFLHNAAEKIADNPKLSELFYRLSTEVQQVVKCKHDEATAPCIRAIC